MTIEELEAKVAELSQQNAQLATQNNQLIETQVAATMGARESAATMLCEKYSLGESEVEITFSEPGEAKQTAKTGWKPFLVSLSEKQFEAFKNLAPTLSGTRASEFNFSEFDTAGSAEGSLVNLTESDAVLAKRMTDAREKARQSYLLGKPMSAN